MMPVLTQACSKFVRCSNISCQSLRIDNHAVGISGYFDAHEFFLDIRDD